MDGSLRFQRRGVQVTVPLGIFLHADANSLLPGSELAWMQVVRLSAEQKAGKDGTVQTCTQRPEGYTAKPTSPPTYQYPYSTNGDLIDIPGIKLKTLYSGEERHFYAESYLMCRANSKATYVPIAVVRWQYESAAVTDSNPLLTDPYLFPVSGKELVQPLGWSLVPGSTTSKIEALKPATTLEDFPRWDNPVGP